MTAGDDLAVAFDDADLVPVAGDPPRLRASRDPGSGAVYFPPRRLAADGSLRRCELLDLTGRGTLYSWAIVGGVAYGQVDLDEGPRVQCVLVGEDHAIDAAYRVEFEAGEDGGAPTWRFGRE